MGTDRTPIPPEAFDAAIDRLDRDALAAFVGRLEAAADEATEVAVDPPVVSVSGDNDRRRILVAPDASDTDADRSDSADRAPDSVVVGPDGPTTTGHGVPVRTTDDLRQQLLYAASPEAAASIAEELLDVPARSTSYAPEHGPTPATGEDAGTDPGAAEADSSSEIPDEPVAPVSGDSADPTSHARSARTPTNQQGPRPPETTNDSGTDATRTGAGIVVIGAVVVVMLAIFGGVVYAAEVSPGGDAGAFAAPAPVGSDGLSEADIDRRSRDPIDKGSAVATATPTPGEPDGSGALVSENDTEAVRNARPAPTCERSFLNVVQIQMNALRYNNNTTDDGIRTVRRFASPRNRQTIQTFDEFARVIKTSAYSPMLSHDSAQFTPIQSSDDYAQVKVLTREDGNVTGKYYFRVRKIDGGEYDGCWMTDAVVSVPETTNFSGKVGTQSTGGSNGTS